MSPTKRTADVHALPDSGTGERVPLQPLLDQTAENRNSARPLPDGTANQNLVPEPPHEAQERAARRQRDQRTGATRARGAGDVHPQFGRFGRVQEQTFGAPFGPFGPRRAQSPRRSPSGDALYP